RSRTIPAQNASHRAPRNRAPWKNFTIRFMSKAAPYFRISFLGRHLVLPVRAPPATQIGGTWLLLLQVAGDVGADGIAPAAFVRHGLSCDRHTRTRRPHSRSGLRAVGSSSVSALGILMLEPLTRSIITVIFFMFQSLVWGCGAKQCASPPLLASCRQTYVETGE